MEAHALNSYDLDTYFALEQQGETRYEYYDGYIHAMAGGTPRHAQLAMNAGTALNNALRKAGKPCRVYSSDLKVSIRAANMRVYPDVSVVCGAPAYDPQEARALVNPTLAVEVLSESSEGMDRGLKFRGYRSLESLRDYVLVSQERAVVEIFSRSEQGLWSIETAVGLEAEFDLPSLGVRLSNADIYFGIEDLKEGDGLAEISVD
jgi:Uma2 family endonuclease